MIRTWAGSAVTILIVVGVVAVLFANFQPGDRVPGPPTASEPPEPAAANATPTASVREYPIGEPVAKNHVQVAAVWLNGVAMDGMPASADVIHLEADVRATEGNPNGFAKDEFVPYLKVAYALVDASTGSKVEEGAMLPMVASDGLHYGASVARPKPGRYKLTYRIDPPSSGGLGRHVGPGGVAPWWEPFDASFDWDVEP